MVRKSLTSYDFVQFSFSFGCQKFYPVSVWISSVLLRFFSSVECVGLCLLSKSESFQLLFFVQNCKPYSLSLLQKPRDIISYNHPIGPQGGAHFEFVPVYFFPPFLLRFNSWLVFKFDSFFPVSFTLLLSPSIERVFYFIYKFSSKISIWICFLYPSSLLSIF